MRERINHLLTERRRELIEVAVLIAAVKIFIWVFGTTMVSLFSAAPDVLSSPHWLADIWHKWDAWWYVKIAETGYPSTGEYTYLIAFFPLFPLVTHLVALTLRGDEVVASLLVANTLSFLGLFLFYLLAREEFGRRVAWSALVVLLLFPSAYILSAGYSEGPYLLFTVGAFYLARQARWAGAGIFGLLAAATRLAGIFLLPALLVEFVLQVRERSVRKRRAAWLFLIPCGLLFYLSLNQTLFADPWAFVDIINSRWQRSLTWPGVSFINSWEMIGTFPYGPFEFNRGVMEIAGGLVLIVSSMMVLLRLRLSYTVFTLLSVLLVLATSKLESVWRYALAVFPLFFVLGMAAERNKTLQLIWWIVSTGLLLIFLLLFLTSQGGY